MQFLPVSFSGLPGALPSPKASNLAKMQRYHGQPTSLCYAFEINNEHRIAKYCQQEELTPFVTTSHPCRVGYQDLPTSWIALQVESIYSRCVYFFELLRLA